MSTWRICSDDGSNYRWEAVGSFLPLKLDNNPKGTPISPYPSMADLIHKVVETHPSTAFAIFSSEPVSLSPLVTHSSSVKLKEQRGSLIVLNQEVGLFKRFGNTRKTTNRLIPAASFIREVRAISYRFAPDIGRWQAEALVAIQKVEVAEWTELEPI
ncbi:uncharacterized protein LOC120162847 [Hibiscus syriacus]|uniref:uncharacterized protein LOC120162847 n=1 Tax=Hibiscus syriacus TaxID=106335 RepID=UPI0019244B43|nr:uncharacterized protein LOC120162847 [Hibiscus syriacus]